MHFRLIKNVLKIRNLQLLAKTEFQTDFVFLFIKRYCKLKSFVVCFLLKGYPDAAGKLGR